MPTMGELVADLEFRFKTQVQRMNEAILDLRHRGAQAILDSQAQATAFDGRISTVETAATQGKSRLNAHDTRLAAIETALDAIDPGWRPPP